jgi:hypothetical protein
MRYISGKVFCFELSYKLSKLADVVVQKEERKGHGIPRGIVLLIIDMLAFCGHACHLSLSSWQL